jgi:flagellar hook protein FlgE
MSSGSVTPQFTKDVTVYDAQGNSHTIAMNFVKINTNTWAMELTAVPATDVNSTIKNASGVGDGQIASGTLMFNGSGNLTSVTGTIASSIPINWTNGAAGSTLTLNLGVGTTTGLIQSAAAFNVSAANQNGSPVGELTGVSIDENGYVIAAFSNGQTQKLFQVPLAEVNNPDGLESISGNAYQQTVASGIANLELAGTSGVGTFTPSALEQSNVDLSTQLTDLIVAQQAYGANSKVLTVADSLLQELDQIIQ